MSLARQALDWPEVRRLMTVTGVNVICAATFMAAIGHANRFMTARKLVAYLGLDPKVRQSGDTPARSGRVSKRGSASARWALVEAAWSVARQPGPLRAFYQRTKARRGHGKAIVATAQTVDPVLVPADSRPGLRPPTTITDPQKTASARTDRRAAKNTRRSAGIHFTRELMRTAERELAEQAERSYRRIVTDQKGGAPARKVGASATPERASI